METKAHLKQPFLEELEVHGNVSRAARAVGIHRRTAGFWRTSDTDFKKAMNAALKKGREA